MIFFLQFKFLFSGWTGQGKVKSEKVRKFESGHMKKEANDATH